MTRRKRKRRKNERIVVGVPQSCRWGANSVYCTRNSLQHTAGASRGNAYYTVESHRLVNLCLMFVFPRLRHAITRATSVSMVKAGVVWVWDCANRLSRTGLAVSWRRRQEGNLPDSRSMSHPPILGHGGRSCSCWIVMVGKIWDIRWVAVIVKIAARSVGAGEWLDRGVYRQAGRVCVGVTSHASEVT